MRFTSPTLLFVVFLPNIPFVSAIPTTSPDKNKHSKAPGCPALKSTAYIFTKYYNDHLKKGDLFTSRKGIPLLKSRDSPEPENRNFNLTKYALLSLSSDLPLPLPLTRKGGEELGVKSKRTPPVVYCGTLSCIINREVSEPFGLIAGVYYDVIVDYPYVGATGGLIGVFAQFTVNGVAEVVRLGMAHTGFGGICFAFQSQMHADWYQIVFAGENLATAAVTFFLRRRAHG